MSSPPDPADPTGLPVPAAAAGPPGAGDEEWEAAARGHAPQVFGARLPQAKAYADMLATLGVTAGVIGPREGPRLWARHLLNSAAVAPLLPEGALVVDVGSGAGLPGIPLALARPDLRFVLVEPLLRRCAFLGAVLARLELAGQVTVERGRAPEIAAGWERLADVAVARAVAPLEKLAAWTLPLLVPGGLLVALRGRSVDAEAALVRPQLGALGAAELQTMALSTPGLPDVSVAVLSRSVQPSRTPGRGAQQRRRRQ